MLNLTTVRIRKLANFRIERTAIFPWRNSDVILFVWTTEIRSAVIDNSKLPIFYSALAS